MSELSQNAYDAVVIGAGIGGLVCGCYLARAGLRVLIAEQHHKPGGYCTSFKRQGFEFDAAAHSLGGFNNGYVGRVFNDLKVVNKVNFIKADPSDIIITPDFKISFWSGVDKTLHELQSVFPDEKDNIHNFFHLITTAASGSMSVLRKKTFKDLLDQFFVSEKLKTSVFFPLFGNGGLPPSKMSAFIGVKVFQEFLLDGGYYPQGGMQVLSNALAAIFKEFGGELRLSSRINKIRVEDQRVIGVESETDGFISSKNVVSDCDARQTFLNLLGGDIIPKEFARQLYDMEPSLSGFILYLGIDDYLNGRCSSSPNQWILSHYDMDAAYLAAKKGEVDNIVGYVVHTNPRAKTIFAFVNAPFKNKKYWEDNVERWTELFIKRIEREVMPGLTEHILYKGAATPQTLQRYTSNYKGAAFGWASTPSQLALPDFKKPSFIRNLFLTGHWTTQGIGIPGVLYIGYDTAKMILRKESRYNILL